MEEYLENAKIKRNKIKACHEKQIKLFKQNKNPQCMDNLSIKIWGRGPELA